MDTLPIIVQVIKNNRELRQWFGRLAASPAAMRRRNDIDSIVAAMNAGNEDPDLIAAFQMLTDPIVFRAVQEALGDK